MKKFLRAIKGFMDIKYSEAYAGIFSEDDKRKHILTNYIAGIAILTMLGYALVYSILDFNLFSYSIIYLLACSIVAFCIILINKKGFYRTAKVINTLFITFYMAYTAVYIFEKETGFHVFLLVGAIIPLFQWNFKNKINYLLFIPLNLVLYLVIEFSPPFFEPKIILPVQYISFFKGTSIFASFMTAGVAIVIYQTYANIRENELIKQSKKLKLSQIHKDKIHSIIGHDLRSPFYGLSALINILINDFDKLDSEKKLDYLKEIKKSTGSIRNLLENLLDWSKVQSENFEENISKFELLPVINEVLNLFENQLIKKSITLKNEIDNKTVITGDKHMVSTVFRNLISNAIKYSYESGKICICKEDKEEEIQFCISDSGIGISDKNINQLFDIQQNHTTPGTANEKGSGLGLILCKEFVEKNKGRIWVESERDHGSKFCFTLPTG